MGFKQDRDLGKDVLEVRDLTLTLEGETLLNNLNFRIDREDKVCFLSNDERAVTALFKVLEEQIAPDSGSFKWGVSTSQSFFPKDNGPFFDESPLNIIDWLKQYSGNEETETYLRSFLGRMLFSGDEVYKPVKVLSGGERVRCMLSRMMMFGSNVLVLDQPTDHLDLESITAVNDGLKEFKGVVMFATHDHEFAQTVANRIIEIVPEGVIDRRCSYDEYVEYRGGALKG